MRINKAGDDASGLAVSEKLRSQVRGLQQAERNTMDGIAFIQVAEGALQEVHSILHRMRELSIQTANGIYSDADRRQIQVEVSQLSQEVDRIATTTEFNKYAMLDGTLSNMVFHVGANADQNIKVWISAMTASALNVKGLSLSTAALSNAALARIDLAVDAVSAQRANFGAWQNRLEHTAASISVAWENLQAAESRIRDADIATEMVNFTRQQILLETGTAMLAQANMRPRSVVKLLLD